jgi:hypothetical protein
MRYIIAALILTAIASFVMAAVIHTSTLTVLYDNFSEAIHS